MSKLIAIMSMSLDGCAADRNEGVPGPEAVAPGSPTTLVQKFDPRRTKRRVRIVKMPIAAPAQPRRWESMTGLVSTGKAHGLRETAPSTDCCSRTTARERDGGMPKHAHLAT